MTRLELACDRFARWDLAVCERFNRASRRPPIRLLFAAVSRLADGLVWYTLMLILLVWHRSNGVRPVLHMALAGGVCTLFYKGLKHATARPRPCDACAQIQRRARPLDQFSFPSGHTLHAVAFSLVASAYYPGLLWLLVPYTLLVALSRRVLGLHYPTDALAGGALGAVIAALSFIV
ncbi:MAG: phosphatase PAP2 family protein [Burkholderiales bacterium]